MRPWAREIHRFAMSENAALGMLEKGGLFVHRLCVGSLQYLKRSLLLLVLAYLAHQLARLLTKLT